MKNLLLTLVAFSVLLLIGCQENSITDPIQDSGLQKSDDPSVHTGTMTLEGTLELPNQPNSYLSINGQADYVHELFFIDPIPPAPQYYVSLGLSVNADLSDLSSPIDPIYSISEQTEDLFYVSEEGIYLLEKTFSIQGRDDSMVLRCRFLVTTNGIGLNSMWLEFGNDISNVNN
ncbi:MAG: hypothetical protein OQK56_01875 [Ignavibacteriaceae bacterium]|jgi:hypothetical protein|nr:hypothetical protein [Ignavibacteriaceae bacterium]